MRPGAGRPRKTCSKRCRQAKSSFAKKLKVRGITGYQYDEILQRQDGVCGVCRMPPPPSKTLIIDHCHETGDVRGLLCISCNRGLGFLGDTTNRIAAALSYLTAHNPNASILDGAHRRLQAILDSDTDAVRQPSLVDAGRKG